MSEQKKITEYLDRKCFSIDSVIMKQQAIIEKLKEYKISFVTEAVTKGLNKNVPLIDSGTAWMGNVPAGWKKYRIANLYDQTSISGREDLPILTVSINSGGIHDHPVDRYDLRMLTMEYLDALRDAKRELNSNSDKKLLFKILNDRDSGQFKIIKEKIIDLEKAIKDDKNVLESLKKDIMDYLERISLQTETSSNIVNFQFTSIELAEILKKIGLQYGDEAVSIDRNGLGRNNLLYMAVVLAHLYEKENTFFRVVAIEEPEAHLW